MELFSCNHKVKPYDYQTFGQFSGGTSQNPIERQHFRAANATLPSVWHDLRGEVVSREQFVWGSVVRF